MAATTRIAKVIFEMQCTLKLYHWKTTNYARHKTTDTLVDNIVQIGDKLMETMITRYGRPESVSMGKVGALSDSEITKYLSDALVFWSKDFDKLILKKDLDLYNIRDEIVGLLNHTMYMLTLN